MRKIFLLLFFALTCTAHADAAFDSLFARSEVIVYGEVIRNKTADYEGDLDARNCKVDVLVNSVGIGGKPVKNLIRLPAPGDTIRNISYVGGIEGDTMLQSSYYVFPLDHDSSGWKLTQEDYHTGVFRDYGLLIDHCPVVYVPGDTAEAAPIKIVTTIKNGWETVTLYYPNELKRSVSKSKWTGHKKIYKRTEYNQQGKVIERSRTKTKRVVHHITWTFRKAGKPCIRRTSVWILD